MPARIARCMGKRNEMSNVSKCLAIWGLPLLALAISSPAAAQNEFRNIIKQGLRDAQRQRTIRRQPANAGSQMMPQRSIKDTRRPEIARQSKVSDCDAAAAHPDDPQKVTEGVPDEDIDLVAALEQCTQAIPLASSSEMPRIMFQTGRVLWLAEEFEEAMPFLLDAAEAGEPAATAYLGDAYANGLGGAEEDLETALAFYTQAAAAGFLPADAMADELATEMAEPSAAPVQIAAATAHEVNDCDRLAAHPADPRKIATGVTDDVMDVNKAIAICAAAAAKFPGNARLDYQHGRSLFLAGRENEALPILATAAEKGSAAAKATIADAYLVGIGGLDQDIGAAYAYYQEAATGGFKPAAANVAELKASFSPEVSTSSSSAKMTLSCEVLATISAPNGEPADYFVTKPIIYIDFQKGDAAVGGLILTVDGKPLFGDDPYEIQNSDDQIRFESESLGDDREGGTFIIDTNNGEVSYYQKYLFTQMFGFPLKNTLELEGYCAPQQK